MEHICSVQSIGRYGETTKHLSANDRGGLLPFQQMREEAQQVDRTLFCRIRGGDVARHLARGDHSICFLSELVTHEQDTGFVLECCVLHWEMVMA